MQVCMALPSASAAIVARCGILHAHLLSRDKQAARTRSNRPAPAAGLLDTNLPAPTPLSFAVKDPGNSGPLANSTVVTMNGYFGARPNKSFSTITDIYSGVTSNFEALVGEYKHRLSHHVSFDANYTWSHALDFGESNSTGASANAVFDVNNLKLEKGNSNQDVPNRLVIYTVGDSPWRLDGPLGYLLNDYEIAPSFQTQNGLPYSAGISTSASKLYT
jgi:hypothetical protein